MKDKIIIIDLDDLLSESSEVTTPTKSVDDLLSESSEVTTPTKSEISEVDHLRQHYFYFIN